MSPEPVAAERAYQRIKADLISGRYRPGTVLVERLIAQEFAVSVSPIRDSAQRLLGEGLLEVASGGGYRIPDLTRERLEDLLKWHDHLVRSILRSGPGIMHCDDPSIEHDGDGTNVIADATTSLFRNIALSAENREYERALLSANDRLHAIRLHENRILANLRDEFDAVRSSTRHGSGSDRYEAISAYHRRRIRRAGKLANLLYV